MANVVEWFSNQPLLVLMIIMALGYFVGRIRIGSFSLGVAAVLFVGLIISAVMTSYGHPVQQLKILWMLGLTLFVYTIGLDTGWAFFRALRTNGLGLNLLTIVMVIVGAGITVGLVALFKLEPITSAGMFTGAMTNTPALAAVVGALPGLKETAGLQAQESMAVAQSLPTVGYALAYPLGVLASIAALAIFQKIFHVNHQEEAVKAGLADIPIYTRNVLVTKNVPLLISDLNDKVGHHIIVSRMLTPDAYEIDETLTDAHGYPEEVQVNAGKMRIASVRDTIQPGMIVCLTGTVEALDAAEEYLGEETAVDLAYYDTTSGLRRMFVSNPNVVGIRLGRLGLQRRYGILITRIRRGDMDVVATDDSRLELGDRVRVITSRENLGKAARILGDSYKSLSEIDLLTFAVGITLGLLVGNIPFPIPGGGVLELGSAGGPLIVGLVLGALGRTGPIVWRIPYSSNLTIRQFGITLFLAAIGANAGADFLNAITNPSSLMIILGGAIITFILTVLIALIVYKGFKLPYGQAMGVVAGIFTQPATLGYANDQTNNDLPNTGYSTVYPMAMISKIIVAQLLIILLLKTGVGMYPQLINL
ncbi:MAG TPA: transporter [Corynebacteriales bacterium]|nr:transporter [Mycobacteriales bacterium]